jgi:predicted N-acetyltransferase YhbS
MIAQLERVKVSRPVARVSGRIARNTPNAASLGQPDRRCAAKLPPAGCRKETAVRVASCLNDWLSAFRLVYEAYTRTGLAAPNPRGMRITPYQLLPTTEVFVATDGDRAVCTLSLVCDGLLGLPLEDVYADEVALRRKQGLVLAEVSCLANGQEGDRSSFSTVLQLMRLCVQSAKARGIDQLVIAVHPHHAPFYERFFGFERFGEQRSYGAVQDAPAVALALDLNRLAENHPQGYERLFGNAFPADQLAYRPMPDDLRREFAVSMPDLAASNECLRKNQPQADSPVACVNCKNLCRRRALIALKVPGSIAL